MRKGLTIIGILAFVGLFALSVGYVGSDNNDYIDSPSKEAETFLVEENVSVQGQEDLAEANWDNFKVEVNGKVLAFPFSILELEEAGFTLDEEDTDGTAKVPAESFRLACFRDEEGNEIMVSLQNGSEKEQSFLQCEVGSLTVEGTSIEEGGADVVFPGGVMLGMEEGKVLSTYGTEAERSEFDGKILYTWAKEGNYYQSVDVMVDAKSGEVVHLTMTMFS